MDKAHELKILEELSREQATDIYVYGYRSRKDSRKRMAIVEDKIVYKVDGFRYSRVRREEIPFDGGDSVIKWKIPRPISARVFGGFRRQRPRIDTKENRHKLIMGVDYEPPKQQSLFPGAGDPPLAKGCVD